METPTTPTDGKYWQTSKEINANANATLGVHRPLERVLILGEIWHMQYEVSMTVNVGRIANQKKVPKWLSFKNYKSESLNI